VFAAALALALLAPADIPKSQGWVTDLASLLSAQEREALAALMDSYQRGSGEQIALLTVEDLGGHAIEPFALEVARAWSAEGVGEGGGVLVVISKNDRKIRIEVGRHFEGRLPDTICARIIDHVMVPHFKSGRFGDGIRAGIEAIHEALGGNYAPIERSRGGRGAAAGVAGLFAVLFVVLLMVGLARRSRRAGARSDTSWLTWLLLGSMMNNRGSRGFHGGLGTPAGTGGFGVGSSGSIGSFGGFSGGGGFGGGGASGGW
jgi:uncharacterized protein